MMSAHRYVAYTSDIGESFRPVAHPYLVRGAYGVSWLYLAGDVAHEGYKAYLRNQRILHPERELSPEGTGSLKDRAKELKNVLKSTDGVKTSNGTKGSELTGGEVVAGRIPAIEDYRAVMAQRAVFQSVASMGLPAFMIHSIVRYSGRAMKDVKNKTLRTWAPIGVSTMRNSKSPPSMNNQTNLCYSLESPPFPSYHISLTSRSNMQLNISSTKPSSSLAGQRLSRVALSLDKKSCGKRKAM